MKRIKKKTAKILLVCMVISGVFPSYAEIPYIEMETAVMEPVSEITVPEEVEQIAELSGAEEELEYAETMPSLSEPENPAGAFPEEYAKGEAIALVRGGADALFGSEPLLGAADGAPAFSLKETLVRMENGKTQDPPVEEITDGFEEAAAEELLQAAPAEEILLLQCEDTEKTVAYLNGLDCVICAQPNYVITVSGYGRDEPYYDWQWGLDNKNSCDAEPADLRAEEAWEESAGTGAEDIVVAVVDTGVDYTHPDLAPVMWTEGENYQVLKDLGGGRYGVNYDGAGATDDPMDTDCGHGTHCASVIASAWNNQEGTAGVNGNVKIMGCRWMVKGSGSTANAFRAYGYILAAKEAGVNVRVINNSWGSGASLRYTSPVMASLVEKAGEMGIVSCFAAGNAHLDHDGYTNQNYSLREYMLVVGAMESGGGPAGFSDYGQTTVDLFAPGVGILAATTLSENDAVSMKPQYLPWMQEAGDSILYEDFEGPEVSSVRLSAVNGVEVATPSTATRKLAGRTDNQTAMAEFGIEEGEPLVIDLEADLTDAEIAAVTESESVYLAFQILFDQCVSVKEKLFHLYVPDAENGEWTDSGYYFSIYDTNWNPFAVQPDRDVLLAALSGNTMKLRLVSDRSMPVTADGGEVYLDTFGIGTEPGSYYYANGTSMATPMAAGVVSLVMQKLLAQDPSLDGSALTKEAMALVRGGTVPEAQLDGVCRTGGYVNAGASVKGSEAMRPVPDTCTENGGEAVLTGYFFGETEGALLLDGAAAEVTSWSDRRISFVCDPGTAEHMAEIAVSAADGKTGRGFFTMGSENKGYVPLTAPEAVIDQAVIGAAGDTILAAAGREREDGIAEIELWKYSITDDEWTKIEGPGEAQETIFTNYTVHFASGKTEIYYLYGAKTEDREAVFLATYDTEEDRWIHNAEISGNADNMTMPVVYNGELLLVGGNIRKQVRKVYPDTGLVYGSLPDLEVGAGGGSAVQVGEDLFVSGTVNSILEIALDLISTNDKFQEVMCYSPSSGSWAQSSARFFHDKDGYSEYLDENMSGQSSAVPLKDKVLLVGPAKNNAKENMTDTWIYDPEEDRWTGYENVRFDSIRTRNISTAVTGGRMYALANSGRDDGEGKLRFAVLDLGEDAPPVPENAKKEDGSRVIQFGGVYLEDGYYIKGTDGNLTQQGATEQNYHLYVDKKVSRLSMRDLDFEYVSDVWMDYSDIVMLRSNGDLTIDVSGTNTLSLFRSGDLPAVIFPMRSSITMQVDGTLTLTGNGTLTVKGAEQSMNSTALSAEKLFINGPTLIAAADSKAVYEGAPGISRAMTVLPQSASRKLGCLFGENEEEAAAAGERTPAELQPLLDTAKYVKIIAHPEESDSSADSGNKPAYTGTWGAPVTDGTWSAGPDGGWTYRTDVPFRNTWGYIRYMVNGVPTDSWFWFDRNGIMLSGWQLLDGRWYYLNSVHDGTYGACFLGPGRTPDGWEVDASGAWTGK